MTPAEREQRHRAEVARIGHVQCLVGRGDRARVDHEGTLLERARLLSAELAAHDATEHGVQALERLLRHAEEGGTPHGRDIACLLRALRGDAPLPLHALRGLPHALGDDMLAVLDAWRHARLNLLDQIDGGPRRVARLLDRVEQAA